MPGPGGSHGGGSRGGGGFGGGSHGGGFGGGGFGGRPGGGFGGGPRGPRGPRWGYGGYWGRPYGYGGYGYGGGCLGGLMGMLLAPIIILVLAVAVFFSSIGTAISAATQGGVVQYDEEKFQDFADAQYAAEFSGKGAYEDYVLLVMVTSEDYYDYVYIAWVGDHIDSKIHRLFDSQGTFGRAIHSNVNMDNYKYSLDSDLARVVEQMELEITDLGLFSSHKCEEDHSKADSHLTNLSNLQLTQDTVDDALKSFTESTGIPMVVVVEDAEDVFGRTMPVESIFALIFAAVLVGVAIYMIVRAVKNRKNKQDKDGDGNSKDDSDNSWDRKGTRGW